MGRGIEKIHSECSEHGIEPPVFDYGLSVLMLAFNAHPQHITGENEHSVRGNPKVKSRVKAREKTREKTGEKKAGPGKKLQNMMLLHVGYNIMPGIRQSAAFL